MVTRRDDGDTGASEPAHDLALHDLVVRQALASAVRLRLEQLQRAEVGDRAGE